MREQHLVAAWVGLITCVWFIAMPPAPLRSSALRLRPSSRQRRRRCRARRGRRRTASARCRAAAGRKACSGLDLMIENAVATTCKVRPRRSGFCAAQRTSRCSTDSNAAFGMGRRSSTGPADRPSTQIASKTKASIANAKLWEFHPGWSTQEHDRGLQPETATCRDDGWGHAHLRARRTGRRRSLRRHAVHRPELGGLAGSAAPSAKIVTIWTKFVSASGFSNGCAELSAGEEVVTAGRQLAGRRPTGETRRRTASPVQPRWPKCAALRHQLQTQASVPCFGSAI